VFSEAKTKLDLIDFHCIHFSNYIILLNSFPPMSDTDIIHKRWMDFQWSNRIQKWITLEFHWKYLHLCPENEWKSYRFGM